MLRFAQHDRERVLKRIAHAYLRAEKVQAGIGISLPAIREMLIKRAYAYLPVIVHEVGNTGGR